jgi:hypothetical protein
MAKQLGPILAKGTVGGINFYKDKDGNYILRGATGPTPDQVRNSKDFENTRRNNAEFKRASKAGLSIRQAVRNVCSRCFDTTTHSRLQGAMLRIVKLDALHAWGEREILQENLSALKGFEWNRQYSISQGMEPVTTLSATDVTVELACNTGMAMRGGQVSLLVIQFDQEGLADPVVTSQSAPLIFMQPLTLNCALPQSGLWVAVLGVTGIGGGGVVVL